jgi:1-acyl-sn-glycerol-3-phosphate acyltransferase
MNVLSSIRNSIGVFNDTFKYLGLANEFTEQIPNLKNQWAKAILSRLNVEVILKGIVSQDLGILFLGNHVSYLDIPLLMSVVQNVSFVAKEEVSSWPLFGTAAQKIETVFVKREDGNSRKLARKSIQVALENGKRIALFPSGTTTLYEDKKWKRGAFEIAFQKKIQVQPFRIHYNPLRPVAYIDRDSFLTHLFFLSQVGPIQAEIEFHEPIYVSNPEWDCWKWNYWSRQLLDTRHKIY